jgi:hypothetical protein
MSGGHLAWTLTDVTVRSVELKRDLQRLREEE